MSQSVGLILIAVGLGLAVLGLIVYAGGFGWFGRLPGDIRIETEHTRVYIPLVSMLLVSIVLSVALSLLSRLLR